MALSFAFDASKGETPETLARRRAIAEAIAARNGRAPKDVGEGLTSLGNAIAYRMMMSKADKAQAAGLASANEAFAPFAAGFGGTDSDAPMDIRPEAADAAPSTVDLSGDRGAFVESLMPAAIAASERTGIDPRIIVAQAAQETGWGKAAPGNNYFGIKGPGQTLATHEVVNGMSLPVKDSFRTFASPQDSVNGYADFMLDNPRYAAMRGAPGMDAQLDALGKSGYATDPNYSNSVGSIARAIQMPAMRPSMAGPQVSPGGPVQVASLDPASGMAQSAPGGPPANATAGDPVQRVAQAVAQRQGPTAADAMRVLSNPFSNPGQQAIAKAILEQEMQRSDPLRELQLQEEQLKLEALRNPKQDPFTLSPGQSRYDASGKPIASVPDAPKPPQLDELYDQDTGMPYKARWNPETGQYERVGGVKAPNGTSLVVDPQTGAVTFQQGNAKPLTEGQSKDVVYVTRATGALPVLDRLGDTLTSLKQDVTGRVPLIGNYTKTPEYQQAEQAGMEFLQAILRKDTGAAITPAEEAEYGKVYLPKPGDSPQVLAQKKASRARAIIAIQNGLPPAAMLQLEKAGTPTLSPDAALVPSGEPAKPAVDPAKAADIAKQAQDAIKAGADPEAVRKRALEMGVEIQGQ
jgi:flagellum-specific peptidoglycan hydrolase FlgJ